MSSREIFRTDTTMLHVAESQPDQDGIVRRSYRVGDPVVPDASVEVVSAEPLDFTKYNPLPAYDTANVSDSLVGQANILQSNLNYAVYDRNSSRSFPYWVVAGVDAAAAVVDMFVSMTTSNPDLDTQIFDRPTLPGFLGGCVVSLAVGTYYSIRNGRRKNQIVKAAALKLETVTACIDMLQASSRADEITSYKTPAEIDVIQTLNLNRNTGPTPDNYA